MKNPIRYAVVASLCLGCSELLGLEEASLDPGLSPNGSAGAPVGGDSAGGEGGHSSGGHDSGGQSSGGNAAGGAPPSTPVCELYCAAVTQNCAGAFAVYGSIETCLEVCETLPEGEVGDTAGHSAHCRLRAAENAAAEPAYYCPHAGPGGNGQCGSNCQALCGISDAVCVGGFEVWNGSDCLAECAALEDLGTYTVDPAAAMYAGAHVQCRLFHVSAAALADPVVHCPHVGGMAPCTAPL